MRQTIKELGGTMPEKLPPAESIKKVETKGRTLYPLHRPTNSNDPEPWPPPSDPQSPGRPSQQLVCQQLENIDRVALEKYHHLIRKYIRSRNQNG